MNNNIKFLESNIDQITTIFHISDIHIRKRTRHDEYIKIFDRFCDTVSDYISNKERDCIIVVTGDIMHDKSELVPESINTLKKFLLKISSITEVVVIIGNHDTNIFNCDALDCLTPIVADLYTKNRIHLLNENAIYLYGTSGIIFGVTTIWASNVTRLNDDVINDINIFVNENNIKIQNKLIRIALYHGMIHGCTLDNGSNAFNNDKTNSSYFNQTDFKDYDIVMLGDVHKHQFLNKNKTIAYAGSLIQQKRDEDLLDHGTIKWNIHKKKAEFIRIKNDFGMIQVRIGSTKKEFDRLKNNIIEPYDNTELPKNLDVKIIYGSIDGKIKFKKMYDTIFKKHNVVKTAEIINTANVNGLTIDAEDIENIVKNVKDGTEQNPEIDKLDKLNKINTPLKLTDDDAVVKIMLDHLKRQNIVKEEFNNIYVAVRNEITSILDDINYNYDSEVKNITIKSIEFNNMFIYVDNNKIDFKKFEQIVGLNASNYKGKSSFIDVILYSIYGECSRGKRYDVLNNRQKKMDSRIVLDVNSVEYIITRNSIINSVTNRDLKEAVSVWEDGINITGDDRIKTHQIIAKKICSYDDMINNSFVLQKNGKSFVDLADRDKKELLCKMARFDIFDRIFVEAKSRHFSTGQTLGKIMKKLDSYEIYLKEQNTSKTLKKNKKTDLIDKIKKIESGMKDTIKKTDHELNIIGSIINKTEEKLKECETMKNNIETKKSTYNMRKDIFADYEKDKLLFREHCRKLIDSIDASLNIKNNINMFKNNRSLSQLKNDHEYTHNKIENDKIKLNKEIETNLKKMTVLDDVDTTLQKRQTLAKSLTMYQTKFDSEIKTINKMMNKRSLLQKNIDDIDKLEYDKDEIINLFDSKKKLSDEIITTRENIRLLSIQINKESKLLNDLENHEYNIDCEKCMKNPITQELLHIKKTINQQTTEMSEMEYYLHGLAEKILQYDTIKINERHIDDMYQYLMNELNGKKNILLEIERLNNSINLAQKDNIILQTKIDGLTTLIDHIDKNEEIESLIEELKLSLTNINKSDESDYDKVIKLYSKLHKINNSIESDISQLIIDSNKKRQSMKFYKDYVIDTIEMHFCEKQINNINKKIQLLKKTLEIKRHKLNTLHTHKIKLEYDIEKFNEIREDVEITERTKIILDYIKKILDKNGLVDTLLSKNIIPYLQTNINSILTDVGHYQIEIKYKNQSVNIYKKVTSDEIERGLNVIMSSGYESYLLDLVFRLALVQINNHIKTNFLLIDEGFNSCDPDSKNNIKELLEFMRSYYKWILIISHDDFIKSFYDMSIDIQTINDGSRLNNT